MRFGYTVAVSQMRATVLQTSEPAKGPASSQLIVGTGVKTEGHYSSHLVFKDAFRQSQPFWHQEHADHWPNGTTTPYTAATSVANTDGYPNGDPPGPGWWKSYMRAGLGGMYESGTYHVFFAGSGTLQFLGDAVATITASGSTITVTPSNEGIHLRLYGITSTVTNIRIVPATHVGSYESEPFHPDWVSTASHYRLFRWMDHCGVSSELAAWANRTKLTSQTQTPKLNRGAVVNPNHTQYSGGWARHWQDEWGIAPEFAVDWSNKMRADLWLCLPAKCTDDYVTQLVTLVRGRLDERLRLWLEYGNECWNTGFAAGTWMAIQTNTRPEVQFPWSLPEFSYLTQGAVRNEEQGILAMFYQSWRGGQVMQVARSAWGSDPQRLIRVFACQTAGSWALDKSIAHLGAHRHFDVIAPNFYWGHNESVPWGASLATWDGYCRWKMGESRYERFEDGATEASLNYGQSMGDELRRVANVAARYGKSIAAYEAGQHILPANGAQLTEWTTVQDDQLMYDAYVHSMRVWRRICGPSAPFLHYMDVGSWSVSGGTFGSRTTTSNTSSPKYRALRDVALGNVTL